MDAVYDRAVEVLWEFYKNRKDGTPQTVAMARGQDAENPIFIMDVNKLYEVRAIELVDMPEFGNLGTPEVYRVTPEGEQLLRERGYPL